MREGGTRAALSIERTVDHHVVHLVIKAHDDIKADVPRVLPLLGLCLDALVALQHAVNVLLCQPVCLIRTPHTHTHTEAERGQHVAVTLNKTQQQHTPTPPPYHGSCAA